MLYIHGKGGSAAEAEHFKPLFPDCEVIGVDYQSDTPWEAGPEINAIISKLASAYGDIILIANSIGAFFSMHAGIDSLVRKAFFISPVVDMEQLIGVELSFEWLGFVRSHPVKWDVPTHILYGSRDNLIPIEAVRAFAEKRSASLTVMENGEHWFHTEEQMLFLDNWIRRYRFLHGRPVLPAVYASGRPDILQ